METAPHKHAGPDLTNSEHTVRTLLDSYRKHEHNQGERTGTRKRIPIYRIKDKEGETIEWNTMIYFK